MIHFAGQQRRAHLFTAGESPLSASTISPAASDHALEAALQEATEQAHQILSILRHHNQLVLTAKRLVPRCNQANLRTAFQERFSKHSPSSRSKVPAAQQALGEREQLDLKLAIQLKARDFDTRRGGGRVRNVMSVSEARRGKLLFDIGTAPASDLERIVHTELLELIRGRDFLLLTHGEGFRAKVSAIVNTSPNKSEPQVAWLVRPGRPAEALDNQPISALFAHGDDRILLGPLKHHSAHIQDGAHYHEAQHGLNCALHAINNMVGEPVISRAALDDYLIQSRLRIYGGQIKETDFYRNAAPTQTNLTGNLEHVTDLDGGLAADVMSAVLTEHLPHLGPFKQSPYSQDLQILRTYAQRFEEQAAGIIILIPNPPHYIAFKPTVAEGSASNWLMLDSRQTAPIPWQPSDFLNSLTQLDGVVLWGWSRDRSHLADANAGPA